MKLPEFNPDSKQATPTPLIFQAFPAKVCIVKVKDSNTWRLWEVTYLIIRELGVRGYAFSAVGGVLMAPSFLALQAGITNPEAPY